MAIAHSPVVPTEFDALAAANRHAVYGLVARWLVHDLRNPAQALTLITELMGDDPEAGDAGAVETVRQATIQLAHSLQLLDRLLRLPRPWTEAAPVSLLDSLDFVTALHRSHRSGVQLDLERATGSSLPAVAAAEHDVEQIVLNLMLNAQEALGERLGGRVVIRADLVDGNVRVSVADNGPGVGPERRAGLFEAPPTLQAGRLRGLGLMVSRGLARRAGGDLVYSGGDAQGARFDLLLPAWRRT